LREIFGPAIGSLKECLTQSRQGAKVFAFVSYERVPDEGGIVRGDDLIQCQGCASTVLGLSTTSLAEFASVGGENEQRCELRAEA
jgi:hypothetical protein